ncbi:Anti-sigma B factor RsbT [Minicystis rosea]|nr:Anti-sigma B factor RsbT [Minicystis rosea]
MEILAEADRLWAAGAARRFAADLGFTPEEQARIAVSVAELASNVAKHGGGGRIELTAITSPVLGCAVRAIDTGPGFASIEDSFHDGFSEGRWLTPDVHAHERRGLGVGLGAVRRLMSAIRVQSRPGGGAVIEAVLWRAPVRTRDDVEEETCPRT